MISSPLPPGITGQSLCSSLARPLSQINPQGASVCVCATEKWCLPSFWTQHCVFCAQADTHVPSGEWNLFKHWLTLSSRPPPHPSSRLRLSLCHQSLDQYPSGGSSSTQPLVFLPSSLTINRISYWTLVYQPAHWPCDGITAWLSAERDANSTERNGRGDGRKKNLETWAKWDDTTSRYQVHVALSEWSVFRM